MKDKEGNFVHISDISNGHVMIWGRSGQGKTYYCNRRIEEAYEKGKTVTVLDYSGSYTEDELRDKNFRYLEYTQIFAPARNPYYFMPFYENPEIFVEDLADTLVFVLNITSYFQKRLIRQSLCKHLQKYNDWNPLEFFQTLEEMLFKLKRKMEMGTEEITVDDYKNVERILARLEPYAKIKKFHIKQSKTQRVSRKPITIIQLSNFPELHRRFLTELMITMMWKEMFIQKDKKGGVILLDEFQFMSLKSGSALCNMLREGRRMGVSLLLSTQFISNCGKEAIETLLQSGTKLIFRPSEKDARFSAEIIDSGNIVQWRQILNGLDIGEAVLKGNYSLNGNRSNSSIPIICKI